MDVTKLWAGAVLETAGLWRDGNSRLLASSAAELARRMEGRPVETELAGRPFRATLERIDFQGRDLRRLHVVLGDAEWDGVPIEPLALLADEASISPPPDAA